ncbi:MAG: response regulator transcription factor [Pedobacter sp.]|nr:MAG: response regulator transcription factor [Pedobacter sp.]
MAIKFLQRYRSIILYGGSLAIILVLMKWLEWRMLVIDHTIELYVGVIAILFMALGIWLANKLTRPRVNTIVVEKQIFIKSDGFILNEAEVSRLGLSKRELEVLQLMAEGLSNLEIADRLFVSLNTIKTHSSRIFEKLEVQRRTQAVEIARKLSIIK